MSPLSRRAFVRLLAASVPLACARPLSATTLPDTRALEFLHTHTGEHLDVEYVAGGNYISGALDTLNHFLRDFRTGDVHVIDPKLFDLLHSLRATTGGRRPFEVISGYRSPATNDMLRHRSEGVAAGSLHMKGQAIDIRLTDVSLPQLRTAALELHAGGVGYYPASNFLHVDTGRVRAW
jgi:uncharacterized protein YcbK (DUF882 family)